MAAADNFDYLIKVLLIGDSGVGKSSILLRYVDDEVPTELSSTIGVDFKLRTCSREDPNTGTPRTVKLQIWDTAGQERFRTITRSYYRGAHIILLVYDITSVESFQSLPMWLEEVSKSAEKSVIKLVVGNKADLEDKREVSYDKAAQFCEQHGMALFETSAVTSHNVEACFDSLLDEFMKRNQKLGGSGKSKGSANLQAPSQAVKKGCC